MPNYRNCTTVTASRDRSSKGWRTLADGSRVKRYHDCWRVEVYVNGARVRRQRVWAASKAEAVAAFK